MGKTEQSKTYHTSQLIETAIEQLKYSYTPYSALRRKSDRYHGKSG